MKKILTIFGLLPLFLLGYFGTTTNATPKKVEVCFTPQGDCDKKIIDILTPIANDKKPHTLRVSAYYLTNKTFANLYDKIASVEGSSARAIIDTDCIKFPSCLVQMNMPHVEVQVVKVVGGIDHNKVIILDDKLVICGSANHTVQAFKKNRENVIFFRDKNIVKQYSDDFDLRWIQKQ